MLNAIGEPKIIILGVGNLLLGDEGLGIHFVRMLSRDGLDYANLEIIDAGICPEFVSFVEDAYKLIIVDAIRGGKEPGTVYRFNVDEIAMDLPVTLSLHELSVIDSLKILKLLGKEPKNTIIVGIEPKHIGWGSELSLVVEHKLRELRRIVVEEVRKVTLFREFSGF